MQTVRKLTAGWQVARQAGSGNRSNQESEQQLGLKMTHKCERQSGTEQWQDVEYRPCQ